ncbi:MAG: phosphodiester glycosidase family protein [Byssovorax sp.]
MPAAPSPAPGRRAATGLLALAAILIGVVVPRSCASAPAPAAVASSTTSASASASPSASSASVPRARAITPEISAADDDDVELDVFSLRVAETHFDVVDLAMGRDLAAALAQRSASLAVNGGYFAPSTEAEGLVIADGKTLSAFAPALGGGVVVVRDGRAELHDANGFSPPNNADFAIQARPRLVVASAVNLHSDDGRKAERTALCVLDEGRRLEVIVAHGKTATPTGPTLILLAEMLVSRGCEGALNLDGGPSTGAAWQAADRVEVRPPRAGIRHAVTFRLAPRD